MNKGSLTLLGALLVLGMGINVWQGGAANRITLLGYAPLALFLLIYGIAWIASTRKS